MKNAPMSAQRRPGGRRPLPSSDRRIRVPVYLTPAEIALLQGRAKTLGMTLSPFIAKIATGKPLPRPIPAINPAAFQQLCRIGNNLNQLTKHRNSGLPVDPMNLLLKLSSLLLEIRAALLGRR